MIDADPNTASAFYIIDWQESQIDKSKILQFSSQTDIFNRLIHFQTTIHTSVSENDARKKEFLSLLRTYEWV